MNAIDLECEMEFTHENSLIIGISCMFIAFSQFYPTPIDPYPLIYIIVACVFAVVFSEFDWLLVFAILFAIPYFYPEYGLSVLLFPLVLLLTYVTSYAVFLKKHSNHLFLLKNEKEKMAKQESNRIQKSLLALSKVER